MPDPGLAPPPGDHDVQQTTGGDARRLRHPSTERGANAPGRRGSPAATTPTGPCKDRVLRLMRERHAEFAASLTWSGRDFSCGANPGSNTVCTLVGILPRPAELRDPARLGRYLDAVAR